MEMDLRKSSDFLMTERSNFESADHRGRDHDLPWYDSLANHP